MTDTNGLRINYNPPVAPPVDYQPPYFPPPYSIPQASEFQHQQQHLPPAPPPHHFDPYRVYQHQQPMPQPPINGHGHPHHQQPGYYHQTDRYLFGDAIHRGSFVVPPVPSGHELPHADGMEYVCIGGAQPVVPTRNDPVSPTYKDIDGDRALTTSSCLRLIGVDNSDHDQVTSSQLAWCSFVIRLLVRFLRLEPVVIFVYLYTVNFTRRLGDTAAGIPGRYLQAASQRACGERYRFVQDEAISLLLWVPLSVKSALRITCTISLSVCLSLTVCTAEKFYKTQNWRNF